MSIVEFIKKEMTDRGMTYDVLANYAGLSKANLWDKMNKRVHPNFGNVKKILAGLDYALSIERKETTDTMKLEEMQKKFFEIAEEEQVSYECVESLISAIGFELKMKNKNNS